MRVADSSNFASLPHPFKNKDHMLYTEALSYPSHRFPDRIKALLTPDRWNIQLEEDWFHGNELVIVDNSAIDCRVSVDGPCWI